VSGQWTAPTGRKIFVCENVTVLEAAADRFGSACPPMVCTDGVATVAALDLLTGLATYGCEFTARADVDPAGFVIFEQIRSCAPAVTPWRFDVETYERQLGLPSISAQAADPLISLRLAHAEHRVDLHEKALMDDLLKDLGGNEGETSAASVLFVRQT
jgi:uncharacterized protein (TIGR02679 family)